MKTNDIKVNKISVLVDIIVYVLFIGLFGGLCVISIVFVFDTMIEGEFLYLFMLKINMAVFGIFTGGMAWYFLRMAYREAHIPIIQEDGIYLKFLWKTKQYIAWDALKEWGIGWNDKNAVGKEYVILPSQEERFLQKKERKYMKKFIYFSKRRLSAEEKNKIYIAQFLSPGIIVFPYSDKLYVKLYTEFQQLGERKQEQFQYGIEDRIVPLDQRKKKEVDLENQLVYFLSWKRGMRWLIEYLFDGSYLIFFIALFLVEFTNLEHVADIASTIWLLYLFYVIFYSVKFFQKIKVSKTGIECRKKWKKVHWTWEEIYECAVFGDDVMFEGRGGIRYSDTRYIYFARKPLEGYHKNKEYFLWHYKLDDIIMVQYSEELYWYLKKLVVLGIKE